jgi:hypothetical protein
MGDSPHVGYQVVGEDAIKWNFKKKWAMGCLGGLKSFG